MSPFRTCRTIFMNSCQFQNGLQQSMKTWWSSDIPDNNINHLSCCIVSSCPSLIWLNKLTYCKVGIIFLLPIYSTIYLIKFPCFIETKICSGDSSGLGCSSSSLCIIKWVRGLHFGALGAPLGSPNSNNFGQTPLPLSLVFAAASENRCLEINITKYTVDCLPYLKVY